MGTYPLCRAVPSGTGWVSRCSLEDWPVLLWNWLLDGPKVPLRQCQSEVGEAEKWTLSLQLAGLWGDRAGCWGLVGKAC